MNQAIQAMKENKPLYPPYPYTGSLNRGGGNTFESITYPTLQFVSIALTILALVIAMYVYHKLDLLRTMILVSQVKSAQLKILGNEATIDQISHLSTVILQDEQILIVLVIFLLLIGIVICVVYIVKTLAKYKTLKSGVYLHLTLGIDEAYIKLSDLQDCNHKLFVSGDLNEIRMAIKRGFFLNSVEIKLCGTKIVSFKDHDGFRAIKIDEYVEIGPFKSAKIERILAASHQRSRINYKLKSGNEKRNRG